MTEAPPVAALTAEQRYQRALLDEKATVLEAQAASFAAGVEPRRFHEDRRLALQRLDASRAIAAADEVAPRAAALRQEEKALLAVEEEAIATATAELEEEFRRRLAEATEAAQQPLRQFKAEHGAEQAKLGKISKAGSDGERLLRETADPKIDEAIERLENAEPDLWSGLAVRSEGFGRPVLAAIERRMTRERQIEQLRAMKLEPENFEHAASAPWRTYEPGEPVSCEASS